MTLNVGNRHFYTGDNLDLLRGLNSGSVDLIYLDPPFNKGQVFDGYVGEDREQVSFDDNFSGLEITDRLRDYLLDQHPKLWAYIECLEEMGEISAAQYIAYMGERLIECKRVLKPTGSLYYHCDDCANYQIRQMLDCVLGKQRFRAEVIWAKNTTKNFGKGFNRTHETILHYVKSAQYTSHPIYTPHREEYIKSAFNKKDHKGAYCLDSLNASMVNKSSSITWRGYNPMKVAMGRTWAIPSKKIVEAVGEDAHSKMSVVDKLDWLYDNGYIELNKKPNGQPYFKSYLADSKGVLVNSVWKGIGACFKAEGETGRSYPTQKPNDLMQRIIEASTNKGDVVLEPFVGSGTGVFVAEQLGRNWIACDKNTDCYDIVKRRLAKLNNPLFSAGQELTNNTTPPIRTDVKEN